MTVNVLRLLDRISLIGKRTSVNNGECVIFSMKGGTLTDKIDIESVTEITRLVIVGMVNMTDLMFISKLDNLEILDMGKCRLENKNYESPKLLDIISGLLKRKKNLKELVTPGFLSSIPSYLFKDCSNIRTVIISPNVKSINSFAFDNCQIEEIVIPKSIKKIESEAFCNCHNLKKVIVEDSVEYISWNGKQFKNCHNIEEFYVGRNSHYESAPIVETDIKILYLGKLIKSYNVCAINIESIVLMMKNPPIVNATLHNGCKLYVEKNFYKYFWVNPMWGKMELEALDISEKKIVHSKNC